MKGGYLGKRRDQLPNRSRSLADLPPLPVMRAQLLGIFLAPASKLVRTLAEPARSGCCVQGVCRPKSACTRRPPDGQLESQTRYSSE